MVLDSDDVEIGFVLICITEYGWEKDEDFGGSWMRF